MDGKWGRRWDSAYVSPDQIITNNLYNRLLELNPSNYRQKLVERWEFLRQGVLQEYLINSRIDEYESLYIESGAFEREKALWPEWNLNLSDEIEYMKNWNHQRLQYLDNYFNSL